MSAARILALAALWGAWLWVAVASPKDVIVKVGSETRLIVDDAIIRTQQGVYRSLHAGHKTPTPVLEPEKPWEGSRIYVYGTIHYDAELKLFRMWYNSHLGPVHPKIEPPPGNQNGDLVLYATSKDGLHWTRPELGIYEFGGSRANNIVYDLHSPNVIVDQRDPAPSGRYKIVGYRHGKRPGYYAAHSPDGLRWTDYPKNPILEYGDTVTATQDPRTGRYLVFHKRPAHVRGYDRRVVWLSTSSDFQQWSQPVLIVAPDEQDDAWAGGLNQRTEFYDMSGFPYGGQFLGLLAVLRVTQVRDRGQVAPEQSPVDGPLEIQLVHSPDGLEWKRYSDRCYVISRGEPGSYVAGAILGVSNPPVVYNDEVWVYYTAMTTTHGGALPEKRMSIGRASWRLDGFVSLDGDFQGGVVETVPLSISGDRLEINVDASHGRAAVEVLSSDGQVLPGYSLEDCQAISRDEIHHVVRWNQNERLKPNQPVRLRFHLKNASLYSFRILGSN